MKKNKKVDVKALAKADVMQVVAQALAKAGYAVNDGEAYGMTKGTLVINHDNCDVQLKPITPRANYTRYETLPDEE